MAREDRLMQVHLSLEQLHGICSMGSYWKEVSQRDNSEEILQKEVGEVTEAIGASNVLAILNNYAEGELRQRELQGGGKNA